VSAEENIKVTDSGIVEETNEEAELTIERPDDDGLLPLSNDADNPSHGKSKMTQLHSNDYRSVLAPCTPISSVHHSPLHVEVRKDIPAHLRPETKTQAEFLSNLQCCSPERLQQVAAMMEDLFGVRTDTEVSSTDNSTSVAETQFEPYYSPLKVIHNEILTSSETESSTLGWRRKWDEDSGGHGVDGAIG